MATEKGVWDIQDARDKSLQSLWIYSAPVQLWMVGGDNGYGAYGLNDQVSRSSPIQVPGTNWDGDNIRYIGDHSLLRKTDGTLWTMGSASWGTLGLNDENTNYSSPIQIPGTTWSSLPTIDAGTISAALKSDGTLWVWGRNVRGVMGQNQAYSPSTKGRSSPTQIPGTTWSSASAAPSQINAIKTDGTLWTWGQNHKGQLGLNSRTYYSSPVQLPGTWTKTIVTSYRASFGWKSDTELWSWGYGSNGTLGQNNTTQYSSPVQITGDWPSGVGKFSAFYKNASAVKSDGTLWMWGANDYGQLGQNNRTQYSSPKQVGSDTTWSQVASGNYQTLATKTDNTLWTWGLNNYGQLGLNNKTQYSSPVQVPGTIWSGPVNAGANVSSVFAQL